MLHHGLRRRRLSAISERVLPRRACVCVAVSREDVIHAAGASALGDIVAVPRTCRAWYDHARHGGLGAQERQPKWPRVRAKKKSVLRAMEPWQEQSSTSHLWPC